MLFIYDQVIPSSFLKFLCDKGNIKKMMARQIIANFFDNSFNSKEYCNYKIIITSKEELEIFLDFFNKYPLYENEFIYITRININLKDTYEILQKYEQSDFINCIYVQQLDKNEYVDYKDYGVIYNFLKVFDSSLPDNPTELDIIVNAYDYVKKREYRDCDNPKSLIPKMFSLSILTPYIVCAGFVKQFNGILKEYNIPCYEYQYLERENFGHDVSLVYIRDMGIYFFDITKDSYKKCSENEKLENESKYSGFMLPYTNFTNQKYKNDNFSLKLLNKQKWLKVHKQYNEQNPERDEYDNLDIDKDYEKFRLLSTLIDVNFELLKDQSFFEDTLYEKCNTAVSVYDALLTINEFFGEEVTDIDLFFGILKSAKRNNNLKYNDMYYRKAIVSRYKDNDTIDLSESMKIITKKL